MEEFIRDIDELTEVLLRTAIFILDGKEILPKKMMPQVIEKVSCVFPKMIELYGLQEYQGLYGSAQYWVGQLTRLMDMLGTEDWFLTLDALIFETRDNLIQFKEALIQYQGNNL